MKDIVLANLGQNVSAAIHLTWISVFQVLRLETFYEPHLELAEPQKLTVLGLPSILLFTKSALPASIFLVVEQLISPIVTITHNLKKESDNQGNHDDDGGNIYDKSEKNILEGDEYFDEFHKN